MVNSPAGFEAGVPLVDIPKGFGVDLGGLGMIGLGVNAKLE